MQVSWPWRNACYEESLRTTFMSIVHCMIAQINTVAAPRLKHRTKIQAFRFRAYPWLCIIQVLYIMSVPLIQGKPLGDAGSKEANWDSIIPVKDSHTRIKPLALTSGHGRPLHSHYINTGTDGHFCPLRNGRYI
jgi:hypothetical protein